MPNKNGTETFTVAKGRSISHQPDAKSKVHHLGPGDKLDLPVEEGERLRALGFLLGEDGETVVQPEDAGPPTVKGSEIKEKA